MNKKAKSNSLIYILAIVAVVLFAVWYNNGVSVTGDKDLVGGSSGEISNGYHDVATDQCWPDKEHPVGGEYPIGAIKTSFYQCCFNQEGQQVDCNNPTKLLQFAIYQGLEGTFSVMHGVTITNTGNVDLTKVWIESATWSPTHAVLTTAYSGMVGSSSSQAGTVAVGNQRAFTTTAIDLQSIGGEPGIPITYGLSLVTNGSATGLSDISKTTPASIIVEKEAIGFDVSVNLGA